MKHAFYIASGLENADQARRLSDALEADGHQCTYKWWTHGSVLDKTKSWQEQRETFMETAAKEQRGVTKAQRVIVLLPGGCGTHTEFGMAIGYATAFSLVTGLRSAMPDHPTIFWFLADTIEFLPTEQELLFFVRGWMEIDINQSYLPVGNI